jgi:AraC-like DNA-binding protein
MLLETLSATTIAQWEHEVGATPLHGMEIELISGGKVEPHRHARGQIMLATAGVATVATREQSWVISPTCAAWIPEDVAHWVTATTMIELRNLQISRQIGPGLPATACGINVSPLFRELVVTAVGGANDVRADSRESRIVELIFDEFIPYDDVALHLPEPSDPRIKRVCAALRSDPSDNRTLNEWAEIAGGSTRTLGRLFLKDTGLTFAQWRRQLRILDAMSRLRQGQSVTSVAFEAGYESTSAFIEMFHRVVGRTPGEYLDS